MLEGWFYLVQGVYSSLTLIVLAGGMDSFDWTGGVVLALGRGCSAAWFRFFLGLVVVFISLVCHRPGCFSCIFKSVTGALMRQGPCGEEHKSLFSFT